MLSNRLIRLTGAAAGGLLLAGAAVAITASAAGVPIGPSAASPSPKASPAAPAKSDRSAVCEAFAGHFAKDIGKSTADVQAAARKAAGETIDDQVRSGALTQAQADHMKAKLASGGTCAALGGQFGHSKEGGAGKHLGQHLMADAASALGISESDLASQLKSGKTLKDIAAAKGMDEAAYRAAFLKAVQADLDKQVAAGTITAQQEQAMLQRLQTAPLPFWNAMHRPAQPAPPART